MKHDFRKIKDAVIETIKDLNEKDSNWNWKAVVQKTKIEIFWGYLEYLGEASPFIITDGSAEKDECSEEDSFVVLRDEHSNYMNGKILGEKSYEDGSLKTCVISLMHYLQSSVNNLY